jgi:hypothetical protein
MPAAKKPPAHPATTINASTPLLHAIRGEAYGDWTQIRIFYRGQLSGSFDVRHGDVNDVMRHINGDPAKLQRDARRRERKAQKERESAR